jgi:FtsP/CotA-like multicopper oxidase with cupredoxin domain
MQVPVNKRIRFRIINVGSHGTVEPLAELIRVENYVVSIDNHIMEVVEADDTPVYGPNVTHVQIAPAQRYSVIINTDQGKAGQGFWMRTGTDTGKSSPGCYTC